MIETNQDAFVFCENEITPYEKTIYTLAMAYAESPIFDIDDVMISELSHLLLVDEELLKYALSEKTSFLYKAVLIKFGKETVDCTVYFKNTFFTSIIKIYSAYKTLNQISDATDMKSIRKNIELIRAAIFYFDTTNACNATYECMLEHKFSLKHTVFDSGPFPPTNYLNMLLTLLISDDCLEYDKSLLSITSHLAQYELQTRFNALYLIMITQIIMHSPFFEEEIHKMAMEMYEHLMFILKNGRIISIQVNSLYCDLAISCDDRTKRDNTTRLQILYGYDNFDTYVMRVDLSHQGQPFIHFNNASPGKVCSYLFSKEEYENIISRYPLLQSCFVEYNNDRWALKERVNCELTNETETMFDVVESEKTHKGVFSEQFSEECVLRFIDLLSNMLPLNCLTPIDLDGEYARKCFNYDILMRNTTLLYLAYISNDSNSVKQIKDDITDKAKRYGIITSLDDCDEDSLFLISYILHMAKENACITP